MKRLFIAVSAAALLGVLSVLGVMFFLSPPTEPGVTTPPVSWSPAHLVVTLTPGDAQRVEAVATIRSDIPATSVQVVPSLAPYVSVEPSNLGAVSAGSERRFEFFFDVPLDTRLGTIDGTLHLVSGAATTSRPLPITLNIWPRIESPELGISISFPPGPEATFLENQNTLVVRLPDDGMMAMERPAILISADPNPKGLDALNFYDGDPGTNLLGQSEGKFTLVNIGGTTGYMFVPLVGLGGDVIVVIPRERMFLKIHDFGSVFQNDTTFEQILDSIRL